MSLKQTDPDIFSELKAEIKKFHRDLLWAMIALFIPLYVSLTFAIINLLK